MKFTYSIPFLFIFTLLYSAISAQSSFLKGYIIKNERDTIRGYVAFDNRSTISPRQIYFKENVKSSIQKIYPSQIKGFWVEDNYLFENKVVKIYINRFDLEDSPTFESIQNAVNSIQWATDTLPLLVLAKGSMNLYQYVDYYGKNHFYIQKKDQPITLLINNKFKIREKDKLKLLIAKDYQNQLRQLFVDHRIHTEFNKIQYEADALKELVNEYNENKENIEYVQAKASLKPLFYFSLGLSRPNYNIVDGLGLKYSFKSSLYISPSIGIENSSKSLLGSRRYGLIGVELNYSKLNFKDSVVYSFLGRKTIYTSSAMSINIIPYIRANINMSNSKNNDISLYCKLGPVLYFMPKQKLLVEKYYDNSITDNFEEKYKLFSMGLTANAGINFNRFFLEGRYEIPGLNLLRNKYSSEVMNQGRISLFLGYRFN